MSCTEHNASPKKSNGFVIIIVLYILLAIILGGTMCY